MLGKDRSLGALLVHLPPHLVPTTLGDGIWGRMGLDPRGRAVPASLHPLLLLKHSLWAKTGPSPVPRTLTWVTQTRGKLCFGGGLSWTRGDWLVGGG